MAIAPIRRTPDSVGQPDGPTSHHTNYVPGYVPVGLDKGVIAELRDFRRKSLPVDLRVERAMVSAAAELCLQGPDLRQQLLASTGEELRRAGERSDDQGAQREATSSVLIRKSVKRDVRCMAAAWGLQGADDTINSAMVSAALRLVLAAEHLHERWVSLIADTVGWEVRKGFAAAKTKSG